MSKFNNNYSRKRQAGESNDGPCYVEPGAVSIQNRIMNLQMHGKALELARAEMYDFMSEEQITESFERQIGVYNDKMDVLRAQRTLSAKMANQVKEAKEEAEKAVMDSAKEDVAPELYQEKGVSDETPE